MHPVFYVSLLFFFLGALGLVRLSAKRKPEGANSGLKFGVYFVIVHAVLFLILAGEPYFFVLSCLIGLGGAYELWRIFPFGRNPAYPWPVVLSVYLTLLIPFLLFAFHSRSDWQLYVYLLVFCFDGFSQLTGQLIGKTRFTRISPGKTLEGLAGGLGITLFTAMVFPTLPLSGSERFLFSLGIIATAFGGDLLASYYKRFCGVKDFSNLLPGHGGLLDRFDSLITAGGLAIFIQHLLE